ncbi:unnamed protein product [Mytilus edulis]|uniref:Uncharacterized protein n=1 Tax=Mytilus edulis TaxID=6550 RepID=A0A8S3R2X6_MYTED|nr:unnamed protein product [Mytilus edulis]
MKYLLIDFIDIYFAGNYKWAKKFYFGTTNLACFNKGKRSPSISTLRITHRYLEYRNYFYEFVGHRAGSVYINRYNSRQHHCNSEIDYPAAGYGVLSKECVNGCAVHFAKTQVYSLFTKNCHHFVNWLANILCTRSTCPEDCEKYKMRVEEGAYITFQEITILEEHGN